MTSEEIGPLAVLHVQPRGQLATRRLLYTNADESRTALSFFVANAARCDSALLACPFFTTVEPLTVLRQAGVNRIQLLIRLCSATLPDRVEAARELPGVAIRYFANDGFFHAKFYVLGDIALLGSANLTTNGLQHNHEIAVTIHDSDEVFTELTAYFQSLWEKASELTQPAFEHFRDWYESRPGTAPEEYSEDETLVGEPNDVIAERHQRLIGEMAVEQLRRMGSSEKKEQSTTDIYRALQSQGFDPPRGRRKLNRRVYDALHARERSEDGDVFRMSSGLWTLKEWHTPEEAERLKQQRAKASQEHIELTKRGMEDARKRGRQIGATTFLTEANKARAAQMLDEGMKIKDVAATLGVSASLLHLHGFRRKRIKPRVVS
jgi:hypothetical protein